MLFLYIEGFSYGNYLQEYLTEDAISCCQQNDDEKEEKTNSELDSSEQQKVRPSGDMPGGFVVYNQTVELVGMLNRQVESVLD